MYLFKSFIKYQLKLYLISAAEGLTSKLELPTKQNEITQI